MVGRCSVELVWAIAIEGTVGAGGYAMGVGSVLDLFMYGSEFIWEGFRSSRESVA